jgi:hypothetical protein
MSRISILTNPPNIAMLKYGNPSIRYILPLHTAANNCPCTGSTTCLSVSNKASAPLWIPHIETCRIRFVFAASDETWCARASYIWSEILVIKPATRLILLSLRFHWKLESKCRISGRSTWLTLKQCPWTLKISQISRYLTMDRYERSICTTKQHQ